MALQKKIVSDYGYETNYHKIEKIVLNGAFANVTVSSYTNKEYRDLQRPVTHFIYGFEISIEEEESMGIRQLMYKKIKELPEWEGSIDC